MFAKKIYQGVSNKTTYSDKKNIVKRVTKNKIDYINRANEQEVIKLIKDTDISVTVIDYIRTKRKTILMTKFFKSKNLHETPINIDVLNKVIEKTKQLHKLPANNPSIETFNPKKYLEKYIEGNEVDCKQEVLNRLQNYFENNKDKYVLAHNDLSPGNILISDSGEVKIIDFEFAMYNDYLFDFASFISECNLNNDYKKQIVSFLKLNREEIERLEDWIYYQNYLWMHWSKFLYKKNRNPVLLQIYDDKKSKLK